MNQHKDFELSDEEREYLHQKNLSVRQCYLCGNFCDVKDIRISTREILCPHCEPKRSLLKKYVGSEGLTEATRQKILADNTTRQGPFWSPNKNNDKTRGKYNG